MQRHSKKYGRVQNTKDAFFHVFCQVRRYTTSRPNSMAGKELYNMAKELLKINTKEEADLWIKRFIEWINKYEDFLNEMTVDENGNRRPTHERILKAEKSLIKLIRENTLFTYLDKELRTNLTHLLPITELKAGVNSRLREMLRKS